MGESNGSSEGHPERDGPATGPGAVFEVGRLAKRKGSWTTFEPVRRRAILSEERGVVGRELTSAGVPGKSTAEEEERCEAEKWPASIQLKGKSYASSLCMTAAASVAIPDGSITEVGLR